MPGGDKAILTLANGTTIVLDSAAAGNIAVQGGVNVVKGGGQLSYQGTANTSEVLYNTVSTPKGGQYLLSLADGSRVWLNAASSLRFPTAFRGADRLVELTGEGFFEVAHNSQKPFHVQVNDMQVKVLGTQFNINGYADDGNMRTTLIEGSVMVSSEKLGRSAVLKPGQQAVLKINALDVEKDVDTEEVMAWKTGYFIFNDRSVEEIMKQVSRWYDVDVMYESLVEPKYFSGAVKRKGDISDVLKIMEQAGVKFKQEGRKIIVTQ